MCASAYYNNNKINYNNNINNNNTEPGVILYFTRSFITVSVPLYWPSRRVIDTALRRPLRRSIRRTTVLRRVYEDKRVFADNSSADS